MYWNLRRHGWFQKYPYEPLKPHRARTIHGYGRTCRRHLGCHGSAANATARSPPRTHTQRPSHRPPHSLHSKTHRHILTPPTSPGAPHAYGSLRSRNQAGKAPDSLRRRKTSGIFPPSEAQAAAQLAAQAVASCHHRSARPRAAAPRGPFSPHLCAMVGIEFFLQSGIGHIVVICQRRYLGECMDESCPTPLRRSKALSGGRHRYRASEKLASRACRHHSCHGNGRP